MRPHGRRRVRRDQQDRGEVDPVERVDAGVRREDEEHEHLDTGGDREAGTEPDVAERDLPARDDV